MTHNLLPASDLSTFLRVLGPISCEAGLFSGDTQIEQPAWPPRCLHFRHQEFSTLFNMLCIAGHSRSPLHIPSDLFDDTTPEPITPCPLLSSSRWDIRPVWVASQHCSEAPAPTGLARYAEDPFEIRGVLLLFSTPKSMTLHVFVRGGYRHPKVQWARVNG